MQTITLNIGLRTSLKHFNEETRGEDYALHYNDQRAHVLWAIAMLGGVHTRWEVQESPTERTLVVQFACQPLGRKAKDTFLLTAKFIADTLDQDCIAVYNNTAGWGALIGSYSHEWGEFNKEYFLQYKGV